VHAKHCCSWDARAATAPTHSLEAHDREILAVAFSPAVDHLLITGSADKVRSLFLALFTIQLTFTNSPSSYTTCEHPESVYTYSSHIQTRSCTCPGLHTTRLSLHPRRAIGESTSGIWRRSVKSRRRTTRKTGLQSCCSYTAVRICLSSYNQSVNKTHANT
jgi:WD40 repeat protein